MLPKIWRSCQVRVSVELLEQVIAGIATVESRSGELVYTAKPEVVRDILLLRESKQNSLFISLSQ